MRLRTDDDIYRARLVYLGPPGHTLPIQLPYEQYGLFVLLVPLFMLIHYLFPFRVDLCPAWEIALAMVSTSYIFRHVDPDRPARKVIRTALTDWRSTRESSTERRPPRLVGSGIRVRESLSPRGALVADGPPRPPAAPPRPPPGAARRTPARPP